MGKYHWKPIDELGDERIMCACGDEQCYKAIEITHIGIVAYEDVSDRDREFNVIELPEDVAFCRRYPAETQGKLRQRIKELEQQVEELRTELADTIAYGPYDGDEARELLATLSKRFGRYE